MKKGYWYECKVNNSDWIFQFSHMDEKRIMVNYCLKIEDGDKLYTKYFCDDHNIKTLKEVEDFTNVFKYYPKEIGRWFKCTTNGSTYFIKGNNYKLVDGKNLKDICCFIDEKGGGNGWEGDNERFFEEIKIKENNMKDLLQEAKEKFPVGTKFLPNHISNYDDFCIITEDSEFRYRGAQIVSYIHSGGDKAYDDNFSDRGYGNTNLDRVVYNGTEWAPTIKEKKLIGYKLIKPEYKSSAQNIVSESCWWRDSKEYSFYLGIGENISIPLLEKAGVLDLWFEPVYENVNKPVIVEMNSDQGIFELEVLNGVCIYKPDNTVLSEEFIEEIIDWYDKSTTSNSIEKRFPYNIEVTSLKVGCKTGTLKKDWEKVLNLLK